MAVRIDREHDHYIHLTASFLATCFGRSLPALVRMKQPGSAAISARHAYLGPMSPSI